MNPLKIPKEVEKRLENLVVCNVLEEISRIFKTWKRGGALIHRVRAVGYLAESGARNIREGNTLIKANSTFKDMKTLDSKTYEATIEFIYPAIKYKIYSP